MMCHGVPSIGGRCLAVALLLASFTAGGLAQAAPPASAPKPPATPQQAADGQGKQAEQNLVFDALFLARATLLTLNDANRSGNYTVLRDLAAPDFQARNTAADLGQSFSDLRRRNFDLYGVALLAPQLTTVPALDQSGLLHLVGHIPTRPQQIDFDLVFQVVDNQWRLYGISIATPEAVPAQPQAQAEPARQSVPAAKK